MLGITLNIDQGSVKKASKEIREAAEKSIARKEKAKEVAVEEKRIRKEQGIEEEDKKDGGAFKGAAIGGFIGSIIGSLKPIQELLGIVAGILQIFLVPILVLMKPFLILFMKVGIMLLKSLGVGGEQTGADKAGTIAGLILAAFGVILAFLLGASIGWIIAIGLIFFLIGKKLFEFGVWLGGKLREFFTWLWENVILPAWIWLVDQIRLAWAIIKHAFSFIKDVASTIWNWIKIGFRKVLSFGKMIWDFFIKGLSFIADLGSKIWDWFKGSLSSLGDLGSKIWSFIKSRLGFGGGSTSVDDALITSSGQVINLNQNDNVLAFQDFSQVENMANSSGGARSGNMTFNFPNYVGDQDELIEMISKGLSKSARGSISNY